MKEVDLAPVQQLKNESSDGLPIGWVWTTLGEIGTYLNGRAFKSSEWSTKGRPIIRIQDLTKSRENPNYYEGMIEDRYIVRPGDLLISWSATLGAYIWRGAEGVLNQHIFKVHSAINPSCHLYLVQHFLHELQRQTHGSGMVHVTKGDFTSTPVPIPPLAEQKRIVEKIEQLLASVNKAREGLKRVTRILARVRRPLLAAAGSGDLTTDWREQHTEVESARTLLRKIEQLRSNSSEKTRPRRVPISDDEQGDTPVRDLPESWLWCQVDQIATACLGGTPPRKMQTYWNGDIAWVSSGEVANCRITRTKERITREGLTNSNAKLYPKGTVLIAMIGEGKTRGQSAILDTEACTNQNVAGMVFDAGNINPEYVWYWARAEYERNRAVGRGGAQPALNGEKVRGLTLPLPPLEEQGEIVRCVEALFSLADAIETRIAVAATRTEELTQAILAKAFRGELVPTEAELARTEGRAYESASDLLARIQSGRTVLIEREGVRR